MAIFDAVSEQMKEALRAKQTERLAALRSIRAGFLNELKKDISQRLDDEACIAILRRIEKQRRESIEALELAGEEERGVGVGGDEREQDDGVGRLPADDRAE